MLISMTGYGRGNAAEGGVAATADIRSVNSRYLEIQAYLPRSLAMREQDVKELVRAAISRGKVTVNVNLEHENVAERAATLDLAVAKNAYAMLKTLRTELKLRDGIELAHLLQFSDVFKAPNREEAGETEWKAARAAVLQAAEAAAAMQRNEGEHLAADLRSRVAEVQRVTAEIEAASSANAARRREKLQERLRQLLGTTELDPQRIDMEIALLADKLDITEECVRLRSHIKFFLEMIAGTETAGRKLNFLTQEMSREVNTIGSKTDDADVTRRVVLMKEELEKIREQLQNIA